MCGFDHRRHKIHKDRGLCLGEGMVAEVGGGFVLWVVGSGCGVIGLWGGRVRSPRPTLGKCEGVFVGNVVTVDFGGSIQGRTERIERVETVDDNRLMAAVREGDLDGVGVLFEKYHGSLVGYFRKMCGSSELSEDLAQETFWRIVRYRKSFDVRRPFRAWMYQIARNLMYDQSKKQKSSSRVFDDRVEVDSERFAQSDCDVGRDVERSESKALLRQALDRMPLEKRELIVMCRFEELPYAEIAPMFNCSVGALKVRLFRALQDLKVIFEELEGRRIA